MTWYNWMIVVIPFIGVLYMAFHVKKHISGIPDFPAGRSGKSPVQSESEKKRAA